MRITTIVLLVLFLMISCENPQDLSNEETYYRGELVQNGQAPFLLNGDNLSKASEGILIFAQQIPDGIVYGLENDPQVYAAEGGEILPPQSWVGNQDEKPLEVSLTPKLAIWFGTPTKVTIVDASDILYIDQNGIEIVFSGSGLITAKEISTGSDGFATLISSAAFSIGGEGGENG